MFLVLIFYILYCVLEILLFWKNNYYKGDRLTSLLVMEEGWIPACAGMTERRMGMTEREVGMTEKKRWVQEGGSMLSWPFRIKKEETTRMCYYDSIFLISLHFRQLHLVLSIQYFLFYF